MAIIGGLVGLNIAMFFLGLRYLFTGLVKFKDGRIAQGSRIRLGGFFFLLSTSLILAIAALIPGPDPYLAKFVFALTSINGIAIALIAFAVGTGIVYTTPRS